MEVFLSLKNISKKPKRTACLMLLTAFITFAVFGGSVVITALKNGLKSYEARLGADVIIVPNEAKSKASLEGILVQGVPGYFYMDGDILEKVKENEGVSKASPQFFLASTSAGCCSVSVQIIGFDENTDFSVLPWIKNSFSGNLKDGDIIVGSKITVPKDKRLTFYNTDCTVAAQLEETGTGLDSAVYTNMSTIKQMMKNAKGLGFDYFNGINTDNAVSSVMIKVNDGFSAEEVAEELNVHLRRVEAVPAANMVSGIAGGLKGVARVITGLICSVWLVAAVIFAAAVVLITNERKRELAVLKVIGASEDMILRILMTETAIISLGGAIIGGLFACLIVFPFSNALKNSLGLPFLLPNTAALAIMFLGAVTAAVLTGIIAAAACGKRISRKETAFILREDV
ncbi:MAG: ABC transporter permease [Clostridia bacterium]|nr:ABC transporter permease [Clostridia bacterium]